MNAHRQRPKFEEDKRRKHRHWLAMIFYCDGERFAQRYTDRKKVDAFADRQKKSPVVKRTRVCQLS
jgi:hypothetical protein